MKIAYDGALLVGLQGLIPVLISTAAVQAIHNKGQQIRHSNIARLTFLGCAAAVLGFFLQTCAHPGAFYSAIPGCIVTILWMTTCILMLRISLKQISVVTVLSGSLIGIVVAWCDFWLIGYRLSFS